jgi:hypothetical protein
VNYYGLFNIFWEHEARPPRLSSRPACHARHERAGGGQADINTPLAYKTQSIRILMKIYPAFSGIKKIITR